MAIYACPMCPALNVWARGWGVASISESQVEDSLWGLDTQTAHTMRMAINVARSGLLDLGEDHAHEE